MMERKEAWSRLLEDLSTGRALKDLAECLFIPGICSEYPDSSTAHLGSNLEGILDSLEPVPAEDQTINYHLNLIGYLPRDAGKRFQFEDLPIDADAGVSLFGQACKQARDLLPGYGADGGQNEESTSFDPI
jgi:hypothetical protein